MATVLAIATQAAAQTSVTYHLHNEASSDFCCRALSTAGPDSAVVALQSGDLKGQPLGPATVRVFQTLDGVPGASGSIPANSTVTFTLGMKKTASFGVIAAFASAAIGNTTLCSATGPALTTTVSMLTFSCTTSSTPIPVLSSDKVRMVAGYDIITSPGNHSVAVEVDIEGTLNGNYDSRVSLPSIVAGPLPVSITGVSPTSGSINTPVTIDGTNFGATQGSSTVRFNGATATATSWSDTRILTSVPSGATSGPIVVTVNGQASNGVPFTVATGSPTTYHLHVEQPFGSLKLMSTAGPDAPATAIGTTDLKNRSPEVMRFYDFRTGAGVPGQTGSVAPGTVTFSLWVRKTSIYGTFFPTAWLNVQLDTTICQATGGTALTTAFTKYTFTCATDGGTPMTASDALYVAIGVDMTVGPGNRSVRIEWGVEGVLDGSYDSTVVVPPIVPPPIISSLTPDNGAIGSSVTISGLNFLAKQGTSTVTFNGVPATPASWSDTSIVVPVPAGATTGDVVVNVLNRASNGRAFTVTAGPAITSLTPTSGIEGQAVTISGMNFGATQGTSAVTFNGIAAPITAWSSTVIDVTVPANATTGFVVVTVNGQPSNGVAFTVDVSTLAPPVITPAGGTFSGQVTVTVSAAAGATIRYTTDNTPPTNDSTVYTAPLVLGTSATVRAKAFRTGYTTSAEANAAFTIETPAPLLSAGSGTYGPGARVTISHPDPTATIRITLTGIDPVATDPVVASGTSLLIGEFTLKARAFKAGCVDSAAAGATYTLTGQIGHGAIAAGGNSTAIATPAGRLYAWGDNWNGQLGDGTTEPRELPAAVQTLTGVTELAVGRYHAVAATLDGRLYAWGSNSGDGTTNNRLSPRELTSVSGVVGVAAGYRHSLAVTSAGAVYTWGANEDGQLGIGSTNPQYFPTEVPGISNVVAVAAGTLHSLALTADGRVYAWGGNVSGQLGDGSTTSRTTPTLVAGLTTVVEIAAGAHHSLARLSNGDVYAWGHGLQGQLGTGNSVDATTPQPVPGLTARLIAAGAWHSLALRSDGVLVAWGYNASGQLGNGTTSGSSTPILVNGPFGIAAIAAGRDHSVAVTATGDVWTWGEGDSGQLGSGSYSDGVVPQQVFSAGGQWVVTDAPTLSLRTGTYVGEQIVVVSSSVSGAVLHYTITGADPTESDPVVTAGAGIAIDHSLELRVRAFPASGEPSVVVAATYVLVPATPTIAPASGTYTGAQLVTIGSATSGVTLRYKVDGTDPTESSATYTAPFWVVASTTVAARAFRSGWDPSPIVRATLVLADGVLDAPVVTPQGGSYNTPVTVSLTGPAGAEIRYTLDGTEPTASSPLFSVPFEIGYGATTLTARAFMPGWAPSPVVSASYTIGGGTLTVQTYLENDDAPDGRGAAAGAGVYVRVNGRDVGRTAADGTITTAVAPGEVTVTALVPSASFGTAAITMQPGASTAVSIVLGTGADVIESADLVVVEAVDDIVPVASRSLTLSFSRDGAFVPVTRIEQLELLNHAGGVDWDVTDLFHVSEGAVLADDAPTMLGWLPLDEDAVLRVTAVDAEGFTYSNVVRFRVGQYKLVLTLVPPPSNPSLPVSGIDVSIAVVGTDIALTRRSDANGRVEVEWLPHATLTLHSASVAGGTYYYGNATMVQEWHTSARLAMLHINDVINGVPPLTVDAIVQTAVVTTQAAAQSPAPGSRTSERRAGERRRRPAGPTARSSAAVQGVTTAALTPGDPDTTVTVSAESDQENVLVRRTATLTVPRGTEKVTLKYLITSLEYPEWVEKQSQFDDLWTLAVFARPGGQQLFTTEHNVNSQAHQSPAWQSDSTTGEIEEDIDVTELAAEADIELTVVASATNIRDDLFPTTVEAQLGPDKTLKITDIKADQVWDKRDSSFYSIPRQGESNVNERWFTLKVTKPDGAQITKVKLVLQDGTHQDRHTVVDTAPNGTTVKYNEAKGEISVRATIHDGSQVSSAPPTTHALYYRFTVEGTKDGQALTPHSKDAAKMFALWRMPTFPRYSTREESTGYDDWGVLGTYEWLVTNRPLLRRLNDFSAEHARYFPPHTEHYQGVTMDMYHFYTYTVPRAPTNARDNYDLLATDVVNAINGDGPAKARVKAWVDATRAGLQPLLALVDVEKIYYAAGEQLGGVSVEAGWAKELIRTGSVTRGTTTVLDTESGEWSEKDSTKMRYNQGHNSHIHIALDPKKLLQWPE